MRRLLDSFLYMKEQEIVGGNTLVPVPGSRPTPFFSNKLQYDDVCVDGLIFELVISGVNYRWLQSLNFCLCFLNKSLVVHLLLWPQTHIVYF